MTFLLILLAIVVLALFAAATLRRGEFTPPAEANRRVQRDLRRTGAPFFPNKGRNPESRR